MLRTHRSLKASCATPVMEMSSYFYQVLQLMETSGMKLTGENRQLGDNLSQCHFVHHKSHMD
jgi:hypothetical protein